MEKMRTCWNGTAHLHILLAILWLSSFQGFVDLFMKGIWMRLSSTENLIRNSHENESQDNMPWPKMSPRTICHCPMETDAVYCLYAKAAPIVKYNLLLHKL